MTAINPEKIKLQITQIINLADSTPELIKGINTIFDLYSDRTYRPGKEVSLPSTDKSYHIPKPLMRIIANELTNLSKSQPEKALDLLKELWQQNYTEMKHLAVIMLQSLPDEMNTNVFQIIEQWILHCKNKYLETELSQSAFNTIRERNPYILLLQIQQWVNSRHLALQKFGFLLLIQSTETAPFDYLPLIFKIVSPFIYNCPPALRPNIITVLKTLAKRSAKETAFLLRNVYQENPYSGVSRLIKASLDSFPPEQQKDLSSLITST